MMYEVDRSVRRRGTALRPDRAPMPAKVPRLTSTPTGEHHIVNHDRSAFITAYRALYGGSEIEADRALRGVELAYAEQQNAELLQALDAADGAQARLTDGYLKQVEVLNRILEAFPDKHARFGHLAPGGTYVEADKCADWCYACKLEKLQSDVDQWKTWENAARGAAMELAQLHGHPGPVLARIQAGQYSEALALIKEHPSKN